MDHADDRTPTRPGEGDSRGPALPKSYVAALMVALMATDKYSKGKGVAPLMVVGKEAYRGY